MKRRVGTRWWATAAAVTVAWGGAMAGARADGGRSLEVRADFQDPGFLTHIRSVSCGPLTEQCEVEYAGHSVVSGTLSGFTDYTAWLRPHPDGTTSYWTRETFTGTVAGCGTGTFEFLISDGTVGSPGPDNGFTFPLHGTWTLVPGSGTGALTALTTGSGDETGTSYADTSTVGQLTGQLTCQGPPS